jgi:hypothetical protein
MAQPYISSALEQAFKDQSAKIKQIYSLGNGWEGWAQVEIALALRLQDGFYGQKLALKNVELYSEREKTSYEGSAKRCDFLVTFDDKTTGQWSVQFCELKCMRQNQTPAQFGAEVGKDIKKVKDGDPIENWMKNANQVGAWVVAITVHTGYPNDNTINTAMAAIAAENGIQWWPEFSKSITADNVVRVWLWKKDF